MAILGFADKETAKIFRGEFSRRIPQEIQTTALRKLIYIDKAKSLNDLRIPLMSDFLYEDFMLPIEWC